MGNAFRNGFSLDKVDPNLTNKHRRTMLDLVLAWGSLDGVIGMLLSAISGKPMADGAQEFGKVASTTKLHFVIKELEKKGASPEVIKTVKKIKKTYERHAAPRNTIAHAHCACISTDDSEYVIFAKYEKVELERLAVDAVPLEQMERATKWARSFQETCLQLVDSIAMEQSSLESKDVQNSKPDHL